MNKLCTSYYKECFIQICQLGETIILYLLNILNSNQVDNVKVRRKIFYFMKTIKKIISLKLTN